MAGKISPMPGVNCASFFKGRCLYKERMNPGLHEAWRCRILLQLEEEYDRFLEQAENFSMNLRTAMNIWERRAEDIMGWKPPCADYSPLGPELAEASEDERPEDAVLDCARYWLGLCLLRLPACSGICPLFSLRNAQETGASGPGR